jgi:hypothetical protein
MISLITMSPGLAARAGSALKGNIATSKARTTNPEERRDILNLQLFIFFLYLHCGILLARNPKTMIDWDMSQPDGSPCSYSTRFHLELTQMAPTGDVLLFEPNKKDWRDRNQCNLA